MRTPLWMVNSLLVLLGFFIMGFILFTQINVPTRRAIEPDPSEIVLPRKEISNVQLSRIYNNDLFGTYIQPTKPTVPEIEKPKLPPPPQPKQYTPPPKPEPTFLDPLKITLKGIIWQGTEQESRAIIADQAGKQLVYRIGDKIEDSYILHIFEKKVILLRSSGQQEIIYMNKDEATKDRESELLRKQDYTKVIKQINGTTFMIDPTEFAAIVHNLGQLIDVLHLSSVYKNGEPVGVRIGSFDEGTLGMALGLKENDVILSINSINATDIKKRLEIYNAVTQLPIGSTITASILRGGTPVSYYYRLQNFLPEAPSPQPDPKKQVAVQPQPQPRSQEQLAAEKKKIADDSRKIAATKIDMKKDDKRAMLKKGARQPLFKSIT